MLDLVLDMETSDPDDFLTLLLVLGHPRVRLKAVTVTPGAPDQIGLVRRALAWFERDIPVGAWDVTRDKKCVSTWHYKAYGEAPPSQDARPGPALLREVLDERTTLVTGAAPKNLAGALRLGGLRLGRWVAQGGFAGEGVVSTEKQLPKFRGRTTCPSFNLNGDPKGTRMALAAEEIDVRRFVSKNVCHGVVYDPGMHERVGAVKDRSLSLSLIWKGMDGYLRERPEGKILHDPLAACCAIDESIGEWAEVEIYREKGEWGARRAQGTRTFIIIGYDHERFIQTLTAY